MRQRSRCLVVCASVYWSKQLKKLANGQVNIVSTRSPLPVKSVLFHNISQNTKFSILPPYLVSDNQNLDAFCAHNLQFGIQGNNL